MPVRFNTHDLPEHGVHIITSVDPSFNEMAAEHFKNKSIETLKPLSVFIKNSGGRLILGYALTWELADKDGEVITSKTVGYSEPASLMGDEIPKDLKHTTAIEPGNVRCFSWDSQIEQDGVDTAGGQDTSLPRQSQEKDYSSAIRAKLASELSRATDVTVSLDGVIFDDGTFIGPNRTGFLEQMQAILNAKVDLLREIAVASQQGTVDEVLDSIIAKSREPDVVFGSKFSADEYYRYFRKIYATEISNQHHAYGKESLVPNLVKSYGRARPSLRKK